jgi:hypothetical protein
MQLFIHTQVRENYAAHDWDGVGECPQYWKSKGGDTYKVRSTMIPYSMTELVMAVRGQIESESPYMTEQIIDWEVVGDDALTTFEQDQLDRDGAIVYAAKVIEF